MKGKRLLAALMAGAMALGMTACSGSGGGSSSGGGGNSGGGSSASDFPSKSVTIIMPWSLGGGPDTTWAFRSLSRTRPAAQAPSR